MQIESQGPTSAVFGWEEFIRRSDAEGVVGSTRSWYIASDIVVCGLVSVVGGGVVCTFMYPFLLEAVWFDVLNLVS